MTSLPLYFASSEVSRTAERSILFKSKEYKMSNVNRNIKSSNETKIQKNVSFKKCMQNMIYLSVLANVNAFYPFSDLLKAYETLTSKRLVEFVKILSFFKNLHLNI